MHIFYFYFLKKLPKLHWKTEVWIKTNLVWFLGFCYSNKASLNYIIEFIIKIITDLDRPGNSSQAFWDPDFMSKQFLLMRKLRHFQNASQISMKSVQNFLSHLLCFWEVDLLPPPPPMLKNSRWFQLWNVNKDAFGLNATYCSSRRFKNVQDGSRRLPWRKELG